MGGYGNSIDAFKEGEATKNLAREPDKIEEANMKAKIREIRRRQEIEKRKRREKMRQQLGVQRARFGSQGISSRGGSAGAVMRRIKKNAGQDIQDQRGDDNYQINKLKGTLQNKRRLSLLAESSDRTRRKNEMLRSGLRFGTSLLEF